jgi:hypothetical protein
MPSHAPVRNSRSSIRESRIQQLDRVRKKSRAEMLISCRHSQVLVSQDQRNSVNVRALHAHPARSGMAQVVEAEVRDAHRAASPQKRQGHVLRRHGFAIEHNVCWFGLPLRNDREGLLIRFAVCRCFAGLCLSSFRMASMTPSHGPSFGRLTGCCRWFGASADRSSSVG